MIQASIDQQVRENPNAHIELLDMERLSSYLLDHVENGRTQLIIYLEKHYMAADILIQGKAKSCILLDAANDYKRLPKAEKIFESAGYRVFTASGCYFPDATEGDLSDKNLQTDSDSCPLFAFDHAVQFSKLQDETIYGEVEASLNQVGTCVWFAWNVLPPNFLRNVQSFEIINKLREQYGEALNEPTSDQTSFNDYVNQGTETNSKGKRINNSINIHVFVTVLSTYNATLRENTLDKMEEELNYILENKILGKQQVVDMFAICNELERPSDLSKYNTLVEQFDERAGPTLMSRLRAEMQQLRADAGEKPVEPVESVEPRTSYK
jgi:hypothetical protein